MSPELEAFEGPKHPSNLARGRAHSYIRSDPKSVFPGNCTDRITHCLTSSSPALWEDLTSFYQGNRPKKKVLIGTTAAVCMIPSKPLLTTFVVAETKCLTRSNLGEERFIWLLVQRTQQGMWAVGMWGADEFAFTVKKQRGVHVGPRLPLFSFNPVQDPSPCVGATHVDWFGMHKPTGICPTQLNLSGKALPDIPRGESPR